MTETSFDVTAEQVERYGNGECWALAQAIADITGWPMTLWSLDDGTTGHVMVRHPEGTYIDVSGTTTEAEMLAEWQQEPPTIVKSATALEWGVSRSDVDDDTRALAARLVKEMA